MSLGSDQLGKERAVVRKGLADGVEYKTNVYETIDELFHDDTEEMVVSLRNKYFAYGAKKFLEEMNLTFVESELDKPRLVISLVNSNFKFIDHMEDMETMELPYDWDTMENDVRSYVSENPITKKETVHNTDMWSTPPQTTEEKDAIDEVKDWVKQIQRRVNISASEALKMAKENIKKLYHGKNKTTYSAKGNPDLKLKSGVYRNIESLLKMNLWESQFEKDYGTSIRQYIRDHSEENGLEERLLSEFGFDHIMDNVTVNNHQYWTNRTIEVRYEGQDDSIMPDVEEEEFEVSNQEDITNNNLQNQMTQIQPQNIANSGLNGGDNLEVVNDGNVTFKVLKDYLSSEDNVFIVGSKLEGRTEDLSVTGMNVDYNIVFNGDSLDMECDGSISILSEREFFNYKDQILESEIPFVIAPKTKGYLGVYLEDESTLQSKSNFNVYLPDIINQVPGQNRLCIYLPDVEELMEVYDEDLLELALRQIKD